MRKTNLPYVLHDVAGIGGVIKQRPEDFFVQELPLYDPGGEGEHVFAEIEKAGLSTLDAIDLIARRVKVPRRDVGYAGLKDTRAVTRQMISLRGTTPEAVLAAATDKVKVNWADRHRNKLRLGHLAGNRFAIKVRDVDPMKVVTLSAGLRKLQSRGMANYFGEQRFGRRGNNDVLGAAYVRGDATGVLRELLGAPRAGVDDDAAVARRSACESGDWQACLDTWPRGDRDERAALVKLVAGASPAAAVAAVGPAVRGLWVSALQSRLFNAAVAGRIDALDRVIPGDLAYKHANGACFVVDDPAVEQPRADVFEISPTGPLIGAKMTPARGEAATAEAALYAEFGISPADFARAEADLPPGSRRPLRVKPEDVHLESGIDAHGPHITFAFTLPPGAYATVFLREFMRNDESKSPFEYSRTFASP